MPVPHRPSIEYDGQSYVDKAVYRTIATPTLLATIVWKALIAMHEPFRIPMAKASPEPTSSRPPAPITDLSHYERVRLRWMKPDGHGGVVPRGRG